MGANNSGKVIELGVPIVGQKQATVHQVLVTIVASCGCGSAVPVILPNVAAVHVCPGCGDQHFLKMMDVRAERPGEGGINLAIGRLSGRPVLGDRPS